jgi:hypothetical protein
VATAKRAAKPKGAAADVLKELQAAKKRRDEAKLTKEEQENAALQAYAEAVGRARDAKAAAEKKIERLSRQITALREEAAEAEKKFEPAQAAALLTLSRLGQSADDIAQVVGLSTKRVRALVKVAEGTGQAPDAAGRPSAKADAPKSAPGTDAAAPTATEGDPAAPSSETGSADAIAPEGAAKTAALSS